MIYYGMDDHKFTNMIAMKVVTNTLLEEVEDVQYLEGSKHDWKDKQRVANACKKHIQRMTRFSTMETDKAEKLKWSKQIKDFKSLYEQGLKVKDILKELPGIY